MRRIGMMSMALLALAACADPLAQVPRINDVEIPAESAANQALPSDAEIAREGFFGTSAARPDAGIDAAVAEAVGAQALAPRPRGIGAFLRRALPSGGNVTRPAQATPPPEVAGQQRLQRGLTGLVGEDVLALEPELPGGAPSDIQLMSDAESFEVASIAPDPESAPAPNRERTGLFARLTAPSRTPAPGASSLPEVAYGTVLPFGEIARSCGAKRQPLGRKVEATEAGGFKLYDSNPRSTGQRTFYITGFSDGCPRQVTAAHVLLAAPSFYELLHYGPAGAHLKTGATDRAYETVKSRVCGARRGRPCGAKMPTLERSTFFVNTYPRADDNTSWSEVLMHKGEAVAKAIKSAG